MSLKLIKKLKCSLESKQKIIFFANFETTLYDNQYYITCFILDSENLNEPYYSMINYKEGLDIKIESDILLTSFIQKVLDLVKNYKNKDVIIYFHNFGKFDSLFLIKALSSFSDLRLKVITRNNFFYEIKVISIDGLKFKFRDSFLLFPVSLEKMALLFNEKLTTFDTLNTTYKDYSDLKFKFNLLTACKQNLKILKKSFLWYYNYIQIKYQINIYSCLTLAALSFKIYRTFFYNQALIYQSHGFMDLFIRKSYKGGITDVYKPIIQNGFYYDVNSLYPFVMSVAEMPTGPGIYGKINCSKSFNINNFFGFISVKVKAPKSLYIPFLTVNHNEYGLVSPLGEWTDTYFSEEIKYALTLGYEFEYYSYYAFEKNNLFSDYVNTLYRERVQNKDKPELSNILKLLLNSLYGRFGMSNSTYKNVFLKNTKKDKELFRKINLIYDAEVITTFKNFGINNDDSLTLIRYNETPNLDHIINLYQKGFLSEKVYSKILKEYGTKTGDLNISVHIASAITAYARIYMHKIKNTYQKHLYYSDTDSIILDTALPDHLVSSDKIGLFKLEYKIKRGVFVAPKLYCIETEDTIIKKSKGIDSNLLTYDDFLKLYEEQSVKLTTIKTFLRNLKTYTISTSEQKIELKGHLSKREKLFSLKGDWVDTKPLLIKNND